MKEKTPTSSDPALAIKHWQAADYLMTQIIKGQIPTSRIVENERDPDTYRQDLETWNDYNQTYYVG